MHKKEGFTLIELLIIIVTIGLLAAVILPNWINYKERAKMKYKMETGQEKIVIDDITVKKLMPDGTWKELDLTEYTTDWVISDENCTCD